MAFEHKHPALVAGDQIVCPSGFREGQEKIVGVIRRPPDERYPVDILGKFSYFIDQAASPVGSDALGDCRLPQGRAQFVEVFRSG